MADLCVCVNPIGIDVSSGVGTSGGQGCPVGCAMGSKINQLLKGNWT